MDEAVRLEHQTLAASPHALGLWRDGRAGTVALPGPESDASRAYAAALSMLLGAAPEVVAPTSEEEARAEAALTAQNAAMPRPLVFAGTGPGLGRSTCVRAVAAALAEQHRVALLDADSTRPTLRAVLGIEASPPLLGRFVLPWAEGNLRMMAVDAFLPPGMVLPWRGRDLARVVERFWNDTRFGAVDVALVDLPTDAAARDDALSALPDGDLVWFCTALDEGPPPDLRRFSLRATVALGGAGDLAWPVSARPDHAFTAPLGTGSTVRSLIGIALASGSETKSLPS